MFENYKDWAISSQAPLKEKVQRLSHGTLNIEGVDLLINRKARGPYLYGSRYSLGRLLNKC